jgi:hypothetical protein
MDAMVEVWLSYRGKDTSSVLWWHNGGCSGVYQCDFGM